MEAARVEPVQPWRAVVRGMESPEPLPVVLPAMDPVARQLADHESERGLREQRPIARPQSGSELARHEARKPNRAREDDRRCDTNQD